MGVRKMKSKMSSFWDHLGSLLHRLLHRLLIGLLHHRLLNNDHLRRVHAARTCVNELRTEVDATSRVSIVREGNPFLPASRKGKLLQLNFGVGDHLRSIMVNALDLKLLTEVIDFDVKILPRPARSLSSMMALN
jgi:hypothetical protein